jgi:spermidine synthase
MMKSTRPVFALLLLFVLSGVAGLIYQSIWSHYLGLTLGHAAYAQTLVLAIFMGGMALGAWLASRYTLRWRHLVLAYAVVELAIGVLGLVFHALFVGYTDFSQSVLLPRLSSITLAHAYQWTSAALLITPQCILLGATFPLLSAGLLRTGLEADGQILGGLYFTNSIGAAAGALLTTFVLLPAMGMPGAVMTAGLLNILVALLAWAIWKSLPEASTAVDAPARAANAESAPVSNDANDADLRRLGRVLLLAAAITGASSFVYEIGWVRMLNQALGTTIHSFELMLAAFIFGLACGGLWIRRRGAAIADAIHYAGYAQIFMGIAALLSLVVFAQSFRWVGWLMQALARTDQGYVLFSAGSAVVCLLVMFPAAFFAGMTLPLFTLALLRRGDGERAIGRVYAANTLGAIVGVLLMVHVLTPLMGVRLSVTLAALADAALGLYLIRCVSPGRPTLGLAAGAFATIAALAVGVLGSRVDPRQQISGVFRSGVVTAGPDIQVPFLKDGKTSTISLATTSGGVSVIATNGKPDASLALDIRKADTPDEITMIMAGALPYLHHPDPKRIAVIGWGSGLTTHTLAGHFAPELIETIEIESTMVDGARLFGKRVARAYDDPRSQLRVEDARTYFATGNRRYDVVVSEPSNPWVSGVASLFTEEFYRFVHRHLEDDGVLVQWVQAYELNDKLLGTMMAALLEVYPDTELYVTNATDFVLVAHKGKRSPLNWRALQDEPLRSELARVGLSGPGDFMLRRVAGPEVLATHLRGLDARPYSDFYPVVSLEAPRSRFKRESADAILSLVDGGLPVLDILDRRRVPASSSVTDTRHGRFAERTVMAAQIRNAVLTRDPFVVDGKRFVGVPNDLKALLASSSAPIADAGVQAWSQLAAGVADRTLGLLPAQEQAGLWIAPSWIDLSAEQHAAVRGLVAIYAATAARDVDAMGQSAFALLGAPEFRKLDPYAQEQVLLIAQLAAIGDGRKEVVGELEARYGKDVPRSIPLRYLRGFLKTWSEVGQRPVER